MTDERLEKLLAKMSVEGDPSNVCTNRIQRISRRKYEEGFVVSLETFGGYGFLCIGEHRS